MLTCRLYEAGWSFSANGSFFEEIRVRASAHEDEGVAVQLVDEQEVATDVAFRWSAQPPLRGWSSHSGPSGASLAMSNSMASFRCLKS
jgi:hypothetical protein